MGSDRCSRTRLVARCCHGAIFGFGLVLTVFSLAVMFWVAWYRICCGINMCTRSVSLNGNFEVVDNVHDQCYFGLTIVQLSDTQRRAVVNYSFTPSKPIPTPTTSAPISRYTTIATEGTSINSISKLPTTASIFRGSSRGESQVQKFDGKKKEAAIISGLAKGDFAARDKAANSQNATVLPPKDVPASAAVPSPRGPPRNKDGPVETVAILTAPSADDSDDRVYVRRVLPPGPENRADEKGDPIRRNPPDKDTASRLDISPTKVYDANSASGSSRVDDPVTRPTREEARTPPRDYVVRDKLDPPRRDDIQSSRRPDSDPVYREPDFDRDYPRKYTASPDRVRSRYDDDDDERGSRGRYDKRDRGRDSDDRYSKGDTRVYPDDRGLPIKPSIAEDRYRDRERYPDDIPKRGDDDRYDDRYRDLDEKSRTRDRDLDEKSRTRDRDLDQKSRTRDRDLDEKSRTRDRDVDRPYVRDDDRYKARDYDRSRDRDDDRYRNRDDEKYRTRDDDGYRSRDDDYYKTRDEDRYRYRDDIKYRPRDEDRYKDDDRYRVREEDRYKTRADDRYRSDIDSRTDTLPRPKVEEERYRPRGNDDKYVEPPISRTRDVDVAAPVGDRKSAASRADYDAKVGEAVTDYDVPSRDRPRPYPRDEMSSRPAYDEDRYRDRDEVIRRPSRYEDDVRSISPTRTRDDSSFSRSALIDPRPKDDRDDPRYAGSPRDRIRDDRYYDQDDRIRSTRLQDSRSSALSSDSSRRYTDDSDRYRTRLPNERIDEPKMIDRREEVILDRRSYASEEDDQYRRGNSRTVNTYDDRSRSPVDEGRRRYRDDESYPRRDPVDDDDYKRSRPRDDFDRDTVRSRDRYDEEYRRYDDRYASKDDDRYPRGDRLPVRKYDTYPDDEPRPSRRDSESALRIDDVRDRGEPLRPSSSSRDEDRLYNRDAYVESKSPPRRRYDDDYRDRDADERRYTAGSRATANAKEPVSASSREPSDIVIREKRYHSSDRKYQSEYSDGSSSDRSQTDAEAKSTEQQMRPLSAKDVIEAAIRHSDTSDQNARKVYYPVFDPRISNLTSPEIIRPSERRGTTITVRRRRHA